jgi:hypothetical protein
MSYEAKVNEIDKYLSEVVDGVELGDFSKLLTENQEQSNHLKRISDNSDDIETGASIILELKNSHEISEKEYAYFNLILQAYENHVYDFVELKREIEVIKNNLLNDVDVSDEEKENIYAVVIITQASIEYWSNHGSLKSVSNGLPWYVKDTVGAMTGVKVGLVGYATVLLGPVGGAVALVGSGALASAI